MVGTYKAVPLLPTESYDTQPVYHPTKILWNGIRENFYWGLSTLHSPAKDFKDFSSLTMTLHQTDTDGDRKWMVCAQMTACWCCVVQLYRLLLGYSACVCVFVWRGTVDTVNVVLFVCRCTFDIMGAFPPLVMRLP